MIPMLLVSIVATTYAPQGAAPENHRPRVGSRRPVDVSIEGLGEAIRRAPEDTTAVRGRLGVSAGRPTESILRLDCLESIADRATGGCLGASSTATLGWLLPYPGSNNTIMGSLAFVGGGESNQANGPWATVAGGYGNTAGDRGTVSGGASNAAGALGTVGGGSGNTAEVNATVGGGRNNTATQGNVIGISGSTVAGGSNNYATEVGAVGGGDRNRAEGLVSVVAGGINNTAAGARSTIAGGQGNYASMSGATIGGGNSNVASGDYGTVVGGSFNTASGDWATVGGGRRNTATGNHSFAAGRRAMANHNGAFVWGDTQDVNKPSSGPDQFSVYCRGGARFFSNASFTSGVLLAPGGSTWTMVSDRDAKENLDPVDARAVLDKVSRLPLATWNYKAQDDSIRHMGPMAQDFHAAFGLGLGEKTIDTIDPSGVALAAIQGLTELVQENEQRLAEKDAQIEALLARVERLEALAQATTAK